MNRSVFYWVVGLLALPLPAFAQRTLTVGTGSSITFFAALGNIIKYATGVIAAIAVAMFVVGAFMVTISGIKEDWRQRGKDLMIGAVFSLGVVLGAYAILRVVDCLLVGCS
jgi:hypothetical protein